MARTISIGCQDFETIRKNNCFYIDKTSFLKEWWDNRDSVTLITRPRRFGKTLNMSMTEQFFSVKYAGRGDLFEGLSVWENENYRELQGTYPVISLSFANVKEIKYEDTRYRICQILMNLYAEMRFLLEGDLLTPKEKEYFGRISENMREQDATMSLHYLSSFLYRYYGSRREYNEFIKALLADDLKVMNICMNRMSLAMFSTFDSGKKPSVQTEPERFYHGFVLGLLVELADRYSMTSNRESGFGRYDVMLEPKQGDDGIIIEFKVQDAEDEGKLTDTVRDALVQIEKKQYEMALVQKGVPKEKIRKYGFAFCGKKVLIGK